ESQEHERGGPVADTDPARHGDIPDDLSADTRACGTVPGRPNAQIDKQTCIVPGLRVAGAPMCDEYYDERLKAFWRAVAEDSEIELDEKKDDATERPIVIDSIDLSKAKPKALLR